MPATRVALIPLLLTSCLLQAQSIILDGRFEDWRALPPAYVDPFEVADPDAVDFGRLSLANDADYLYLYLDLGREVTLQENNGIQLYVDVDGNPATGHAVEGIGAEWMYAFGERHGRIFTPTGNILLRHVSLGLISSPSVSSTVFELALRRDAQAAGQPLVSNQMRLLFRDGDHGDMLPNEPGGVPCPWLSFSRSELPRWSLKKERPEFLRLVTYNISSDRIFQPEIAPAYRRILKALDPDLLAIQEVRQFSSSQTMALLRTLLPKSSRLRHHRRINSDVTIISRFPIRSAIPLSDSTAFLIDLPRAPTKRLLLIVSSLPCCFQDESRQAQIEQLVAFIEEAKNPGGRMTIAPGTPIIVTGDMNFVGYADQLRTLVNGLAPEAGTPAKGPDWDGSPLADLCPVTTGLPFTFTWRDDEMDFTPGRLDFVCYSDSLLKPTNSFVLFTAALTPRQLKRYHLEAGDSMMASDHLPVVVDFQLPQRGRVPTLPGR